MCGTQNKTQKFWSYDSVCSQPPHRDPLIRGQRVGDPGRPPGPQTLKHSNTQTQSCRTGGVLVCWSQSRTLILTNQHDQLRRPCTRHPHREEAPGEDRWHSVFCEACPCCRCTAGETCPGAPCVSTCSGGEEGWQEATLSAITGAKSEVLVLLDFWLSVALLKRRIDRHHVNAPACSLMACFTQHCGDPFD